MASGCSIEGRWPASGITACSAFGSSRTSRSAIAWKSALSCSPTATSVGVLSEVQLGDRVEVAGLHQPLSLLRVGGHLVRPVVVRQRRVEQHERRDQLRVPGREGEADEAAVGRAHQCDRRFGGQRFGELMPPHLARQVEPVPHIRAGDAGVNEDDQPSPSPDSSSTARNASCGTSTRPTCFMRFLPAFCFSSSLRLRLTSPP